MFRDLDLQRMAEEANAFSSPRSADEVEQLVVMVRLELYNQGRPCGPAALRRRLDEHYHLKPLPSERTIARMLARNGLTHGRTGWYPGDDPQDVPTSAGRCRPADRRIHTDGANRQTISSASTD
jgi:hypothetical protein